MRYHEALRVGIEILNKAKIENADGEAWTLLQKACGIDRTFYYLNLENSLTEDQKTQYRIMLSKRIEHIPLQYILGEQEFMGLTFKVNSSVLIPRLDTEVLVETVLKDLKPGMKVLDLCTGSGCIAISLKHLFKEVDVTGADISRAALLVAKENAKLNNVKVEWVQGNLFERVKGKYHVIVSNPPYIPTQTIEELDMEVKGFEPIQALDGMEDGLYFYRQIVADAKNHLEDNGMLFFEIGHDQGEAVAEMMRNEGYKDVYVKQDLAHLDRVVYGLYSGET